MQVLVRYIIHSVIKGKGKEEFHRVRKNGAMLY